MQKFCHDCGKSLPPVAGMACCPFCGVSLASLSAKPPARIDATKQPVTILPVQRDDDDDRDEVGSNFEVRIDRLEVEIMKPRNYIETIADVAAGEKIDPARFKAPKVTKKFLKEQLQKTLQEGTALQPKEKSHEIQAE